MTEKSHNSIERRDSGSTDDPETCVTEKEQLEGGVAAWMTVVGAVLVYFASVGFVSSFGFFNNYYSQEFLKKHSHIDNRIHRNAADSVGQLASSSGGITV